MCRSIAALILALTLLCLPVCGMCTEIVFPNPPFLSQSMK